VVGRVGPDVHEYDLARCSCLQDSLDDGVHASTTGGSLPAEGVDGPAKGDVAESADYFQVVRAPTTCPRTWASVIAGRCGWFVVWLPSRPIADIRRANVG
jgi:hypothetical protein